MNSNKCKVISWLFESGYIWWNIRFLTGAQFIILQNLFWYSLLYQKRFETLNLISCYFFFWKKMYLGIHISLFWHEICIAHPRSIFSEELVNPKLIIVPVKQISSFMEISKRYFSIEFLFNITILYTYISTAPHDPF